MDGDGGIVADVWVSSLSLSLSLSPLTRIFLLHLSSISGQINGYDWNQDRNESTVVISVEESRTLTGEALNLCP